MKAVMPEIYQKQIADLCESNLAESKKQSLARDVARRDQERQAQELGRFMREAYLKLSACHEPVRH